MSAAFGMPNIDPLAAAEAERKRRLERLGRFAVADFEAREFAQFTIYLAAKFYEAEPAAFRAAVAAIKDGDYPGGEAIDAATTEIKLPR